MPSGVTGRTTGAGSTTEPVGGNGGRLVEVAAGLVGSTGIGAGPCELGDTGRGYGRVFRGYGRVFGPGTLGTLTGGIGAPGGIMPPGGTAAPGVSPLKDGRS